VTAVAAVSASCGGGRQHSAAAFQRCVEGRLSRSDVDHVATSMEEGVASISFVYRDGNADVASIFKSVADAKEAEKAEARIGDAHDKRVRNVLYSGGRDFDAAIIACVGRSATS
jgi:hypothetical protein